MQSGRRFCQKVPSGIAICVRMPNRECEATRDLTKKDVCEQL